MGEASLLFGKATATFLVLECCTDRPFLCAWDRGHCRISPRLLASYSKVRRRSAGTNVDLRRGGRGHALLSAVPSCAEAARPLGWGVAHAGIFFGSMLAAIGTTTYRLRHLRAGLWLLFDERCGCRTLLSVPWFGPTSSESSRSREIRRRSKIDEKAVCDYRNCRGLLRHGSGGREHCQHLQLVGLYRRGHRRQIRGRQRHQSALRHVR